MFQSLFFSSPAILRVTLLSTSVKSCSYSANDLYSASARDVFHTETKKLVVPSARSKVPGKSFSHVSSPYMSTFPVSFAFICANQLSWEARLDVLSVSSRLSIASRKEGIEPVVMAFSRGIVTVGDVAWAVKGRAAPSRINLSIGISIGTTGARLEEEPTIE